MSKNLDVFFLTEYGKLYEDIEKGECSSFIYRTESGTARIIYIKRPVPWLVDCNQFFDIITPYGYGGPVTIEGDTTPELVKGFYDEWLKHCSREKIVSEFVRFHLFDNIEYRNVFPGELLYVSDNVVRYLEPSMEDLWMDFEHKVRKNVKKAQRNGLVVTTDDTGKHLDAFLDIYYGTMERNGAQAFYSFDRSFFQSIIDTLPGHYMFFHAWKDDVVVSTELVLFADEYVYSFLGGTIEEYFSLRPNDLLKYEIIRWCKETKHKAFILGGGYGGNDGIYRYKKSFAPGNDVSFYVGRIIHNHEVYNQLVCERKKNGEINANYFPLYRG